MYLEKERHITSRKTNDNVQKQMQMFNIRNIKRRESITSDF